ncbi:MAG: PHP domain-containing protein, partial [Gammaproteobacteria bacterium]|nr:PHP domain-containing protein [Gammaproteobacteria bacterium]
MSATDSLQEFAFQEFAELHCVSNFSFLRGGSHPEELVERAHALGYSAIAITDECSVAGVVKAHVAAKECGLKLIVGAEFHLEEGLHLVLLAPNRLAYGQLCELITHARRRSPKGEYLVTLKDFRGGLGECLALWVPKDEDICTLIDQGEVLKALALPLWIALELFLEQHDIDKAAVALTLSMRLDLPVVASNDGHMHIAERKPLQDILSAVRLKKPVSELGTELEANRERYLRSRETLARIYPREMLDESLKLAERCLFSLDELRYEYPEELVPP